jgi:hypothetical protein
VYFPADFPEMTSFGYRSVNAALSFDPNGSVIRNRFRNSLRNRRNMTRSAFRFIAGSQ